MLSASAGAAAAANARKDTHIRTIAGLSSVTSSFDTILNEEIIVGQPLLYTEPGKLRFAMKGDSTVDETQGSCPTLPFSPSPVRPPTLLSIAPPPPKSLSPSSMVQPGATFTFTYNSTVYPPSSPPQEVSPGTPNYLAVVSGFDAPTYVELDKAVADGTRVSAALPVSLSGPAFLALTERKGNLSDLGGVVAGPFHLLAVGQ